MAGLGLNFGSVDVLFHRIMLIISDNVECALFPKNFLSSSSNWNRFTMQNSPIPPWNPKKTVFFKTVLQLIILHFVWKRIVLKMFAIKLLKLQHLT